MQLRLITALDANQPIRVLILGHQVAGQVDFQASDGLEKRRLLLVASPKLLEVDCHTPQHMRLANALCRYRELAREA